MSCQGSGCNYPNRWHVIPVGDLREHEPLPTCWCKPTPDEDHDVFAHHSLDGREAFEISGGRLPS